MVDMNKVRDGLTHCRRMCEGVSHNPCDGCPYQGKYDCADTLKTDALEMITSSVSQGVVNQIKWERDMALAQLSDIGKGLGSKMDDVAKIVRCKNCKHKGISYECRLDRDLEEYGSYRTDKYDDWFCADGEEIEERETIWHK